MHIKVLPVVILKKMLTLLDYLLSNTIDFVFSNHLPKTLVFMEKELDVSHSFVPMKLKLIRLLQE